MKTKAKNFQCMKTEHTSILSLMQTSNWKWKNWGKNETNYYFKSTKHKTATEEKKLE